MKLFAIFDKDGKVERGFAQRIPPIGDHPLSAWENFGVAPGDYASVEGYKRAGYTCEEVEIVRVKK